MIKIEKTDVFGWESAIRGARNPMNSWDKMDSNFSCETCEGCAWENEVNVTYHEPECEFEATYWCKHSACRVGENDLKLLKTLAKAGSDHGKYLRMINVTMDVTAPIYWWKEFDTYKIATVANSCSTMHKIHDKEFTLDDFSHEHLFTAQEMMVDDWNGPIALGVLNGTIHALNYYRNKYLETKVKPMKEEAKRAGLMKNYWWQMIQLLPSSYNQKRTIQLNYEVLRSQYHARKNHKLDEWHVYCDWVKTLPYAKELIIGEE